nr:entericidin A/B family lipoprotein [Parasphingopyxis marina]
MTLFALCAGLTLAACNTVAGVGEDVQSAGETVEDAAE